MKCLWMSHALGFRFFFADGLSRSKLMQRECLAPATVSGSLLDFNTRHQSTGSGSKFLMPHSNAMLCCCRNHAATQQCIRPRINTDRKTCFFLGGGVMFLTDEAGDRGKVRLLDKYSCSIKYLFCAVYSSNPGTVKTTTRLSLINITAEQCQRK